ncbi:MAG: serine/threonine-protein kinase, partial [Planctomycetota bacterium]
SSAPFPECPLLEDYVREHPDLGPLEEVPVVLIGEEYRARRRWGEQPPTHEDYIGRFPGQATQLRQALALIDEELSGQAKASHVPTTSRGGDTLAETVDHRPGDRPEPPPTKIGKYHVVDMVEEGGQAQVYRAVHPTLSKELVIKLSRGPFGSGPMGMNQLIAEGKLLAELDHPHLARVYDLDFHENRPFLVMEYVRGRNLRHHVKQHQYQPPEAARMVAKVARALAAAHVRGIVHQDVKPGNIVIDETGEPRLIDFGLARLRPAWVEAPDEPEGISGTAQYMPPEQARGETERIDARSDVFALGAVLYFLLVGRAPYADESVMASLERARRCDFDASALRRADVPRPLEAVCLRSMQEEPSDRYASAEAMAADLDRFVDGPRRLKRTLAIGAGVLLALLLVVGAWRMQSDGQKEIITPPRPPDLAVTVLKRTLRNDFALDVEVLGHTIGEAGEVVLTEGERAAFRIEADRDCFVGIWHIDHENVVTQLFPNDDDLDHFLTADQPRSIPGDMEYAITVTPSEGPEYVHVVATTQKWEAPLGAQHGPYVVFATPEELKRWEEKVRGMTLESDHSPDVAERLIRLDVRPR